MSYDNPLRVSYSFGEHDYGAGALTAAIDQPDGKRGRVVDIHVSATETFTDTTTEGFLTAKSSVTCSCGCSCVAFIIEDGCVTNFCT